MSQLSLFSVCKIWSGSPHLRRPRLEWALRARPPIHNLGGCYSLWSRSPPLRSMLCTSPTTLFGFFHLPRPDPRSSFHWNSNSLWSASSIPWVCTVWLTTVPLCSRVPATSYELRCLSCARTFHTGSTETFHMLCITEVQSFSFRGGSHRHEACTDSHHTDMYANPTELCRPCDASVEQEREGRACLRLTDCEVSSAAAHRPSGFINLQRLWCLFEWSGRSGHCATVPEGSLGTMCVFWCVFYMLR